MPEVKQIEVAENRKVQVSKALATLPRMSPKLAHLVIGNKSTQLYFPLTAAVSIAGYDQKQQPYLNIESVSQVRSKSLVGSQIAVPTLGAYTPLSSVSTYPWVGITDVNRKGQLVIVCRKGDRPFAPMTTYQESLIPEAFVLKNGVKAKLGRAYDLKINDQGDIAGVTAGPAKGKGFDLIGFTIQKGKRHAIGKGNNALLTDSGDVLVFESRLVASSTGRSKKTFKDAIYWSKVSKSALLIRDGLIPVAMWSKKRFIAHEKEGSEKFFLFENGKYLDLQSITSVPNDFQISQVHRVYSGGTVWASLSDNEGTSYQAMLIPRT